MCGSRDKAPLLSIITPVFNTVQTIEDTIRSVVGQKFSDYEFIIIDGGSTDGSVELLRKHDNDIDYWVSEPDKGVYDAFNKGIDLSRGDWIYFLGSDDTLFDSQVLSRFFPAPHASKMLYGNVAWSSGNKIYDGRFSKNKLAYKNICQQAIFYHRQLFEKHGKFDPEYRLNADWVFNMKCFSDKTTKPVFLNHIVCNYAITGLSTLNIDTLFHQRQRMLTRRYLGVIPYLIFRLHQLYTHTRRILTTGKL